MPQDNATGNFVKVEQRLPVRIRLVENKDFPDLNRTTVCTANEFGYTANLYLLPNYNYRITAVIQYDNEKRLIPIMDLSMDDDISYEYSFLFEE